MFSEKLFQETSFSWLANDIYRAQQTRQVDGRSAQPNHRILPKEKGERLAAAVVNDRNHGLLADTGHLLAKGWHAVESAARSINGTGRRSRLTPFSPRDGRWELDKWFPRS